jgi:glycine/sarcosine N-methyltransferase
MTSDPYSRFEYRQLFAWPERIKREWPLIESVLATAPAKSLLELGCGPGEHAHFIASHGYEVVGIDTSESMIEKAKEKPPLPNLRFVLGDISELSGIAEGTFGAALCIGNTLPHLGSDERLRSMARGLRQRLAPGGAFLLQILNYDRILDSNERSLPINFRSDPEGGEIVFLRLMTPREDGTVLFFPATLRLRPDADPPIEVMHSRCVELRAWRAREIEEILREHGFTSFEKLGTFDRVPFDPKSSRDLILIAR